MHVPDRRAMAHLHLRQSAELLEHILEERLPADRQMEEYFRAHRQMGGRDRATVADTVYGCLRWRRLLEHLCAPAKLPAYQYPCLVAAQLLRSGLSARAIEQAGYGGDARALVEAVRTLDPRSLPFAVRASLPDWLAERLSAQYGESEAEQLAEALNRAAPLDLRVNALKTTREDAQAALAAEGFATTLTPHSPSGLRRDDHASLARTRAFTSGLFEVQDEGSQLLSLMLEPRRQEMVVDFCAGAGGKTLHLGTLMANTGSLYAFDVSSARLERLKPRMRRAGLHNIRMVAIRHERDDRVQRLAGKVDRVLVDAPCSGTGTLRRNPDIKWRAIDLAGLAAQQLRILKAAAALLKPGGRLVYATCSLLREENDEVVERFVAEHPNFRVVPVGEILARRHITLTMPDDALRLLPHRHGTDGFYAVALERTA